MNSSGRRPLASAIESGRFSFHRSFDDPGVASLKVQPVASELGHQRCLDREMPGWDSLNTRRQLFLAIIYLFGGACLRKLAKWLAADRRPASGDVDFLQGPCVFTGAVRPF